MGSFRGAFAFVVYGGEAVALGPSGRDATRVVPLNTRTAPSVPRKRLSWTGAARRDMRSKRGGIVE